jgi:hypothetical protein
VGIAQLVDNETEKVFVSVLDIIFISSTILDISHTLLYQHVYFEQFHHSPGKIRRQMFLGSYDGDFLILIKGVSPVENTDEMVFYHLLYVLF